jgi:phage shock protein A
VRLGSELETLLGKERVLDNETDALHEQITRLESCVEDIEAELGELNTKIAVYKDEMKTPLNKTLTDEEETTLATLSQEVDDLQQQLIEAGKAKAEVCSTLTVIQQAI